MSAFGVHPAKTVAIIGRSGVGKSVTLSHHGISKPDNGRIVVAYEDITNFPEAELDGFGESDHGLSVRALFDSLTVAKIFCSRWRQGTTTTTRIRWMSFKASGNC
jgi:phospholipid/cholesterol/gamma-HCH transport system ATP-binding protein